MKIITQTDELAAFVDRLRQAPYACLDTEFMRETTYWPKLCLLQAAAPGLEAIIDPLAPGLDLAPVGALLADTSVMKVMHAGRQDMEIFLHRFDVLPAPYFDTQVAAMVCGFGEQIAYDALAKRIAGARIDKSHRFTDWSRRPLSERQLDYALGDVTHLRRVYETLSQRLEETGRGAWIADELGVLTDPATYTLDPETAWRRLKARSTSPKFLGVLRAAAAWREREAQARDVPRGRVLKDETLLEVAAQAPRDAAGLEALRLIPRGFGASKQGAGLLAALAEGLANPVDPSEIAPPRAPAPNGAGPTVELLRVLLKLRADEHEVAQRLIANAAELEALAGDDVAQVPALTGWRREIFGADALRLKSGALALTLESGRVVARPAG